jgi:hypothetical protein
MAFIFEDSKKEHLEKKDYWQNERKSLGIDARLHNELNDKEQAPQYDAPVYEELVDQLPEGIVAYNLLDGDVFTTASDDVVNVVYMPFGKRPFQLQVDAPKDDGGEVVVNAVIDRFCAEFLHRIGFADLLALQVDDN